MSEPLQHNCETTFFAATQSYISCTTTNGRTGWLLAKTPLSLLSHIRLLWCFEREMTLGNNSDPQSPDGPKSSLLSTLLWGHPDVPQLSHRKPNSCGCGCNHNHLRTCQIEVKVLLYCERNWQFLSKWYIQDIQWNWDKKNNTELESEIVKEKMSWNIWHQREHS